MHQQNGFVFFFKIIIITWSIKPRSCKILGQGTNHSLDRATPSNYFICAKTASRAKPQKWEALEPSSSYLCWELGWLGRQAAEAASGQE